MVKQAFIPQQNFDLSTLENENQNETSTQNSQVHDNESQDPQYEICGMISELKEVLLFEQFIKLDGSPENWLKDVENQMQDTVAKLIGYAVSSFPKQSLDEWIVDYPQ